MALKAADVASRLVTDGVGMSIAGASVHSDEVLDIINPSTGQWLAAAPDASPADIDSAVTVARAAFPKWSALATAERRAALLRVADTMEAHREELTLINSLECGAPIKIARSVDVAVHYIRTIAALELPTEVLHSSADQQVELARVPLGVVAAITPWNAPLTLAAAKISAALLSGNTIVVKPSPFAPLATLRLGELIRELLPPGVLNIVSGGAVAGEALASHPEVDKISFTGSVGVGKHIMATASASLKRVTLELGGNDAAIILGDVDPLSIAPDLVRMGFANCGQFCMAIKRIYVMRPIAGQLAEALVAQLRTKRIGDAMDPRTDIGPVQNLQQYQRLQELIKDTRASGATIHAVDAEHDSPGYFITPAIVTDIAASAPLVCTEQFGPLLPIVPVDSAEEALALANAGRLGLGGSVWSADQAAAIRLAAQLEVGTAWVNQHGSLDARYPISGVKESGIGAEYGLEGLKAYTSPRVMNIAKNIN
jgi:acyl-CoA reductase-like NAD-dependent aldehyde dehydrogenase